MSKKARTQKLDSMARCLKRLSDNMPVTAAALAKDVNLQDVIILNLERLVQLSVDCAMMVIAERGWLPIPDTMTGVFSKIEVQSIISPTLADHLRKAVAFRNLCVHEYDKIDWAIVFAILGSRLDDFRDFARVIDALP
jgi:uncharacterized protein YutE (UPF0331/DUF86 family)